MTNSQSDSIRNLDIREHVRLRPGMYIGGTDSRALNNLILVALEDSAAKAVADKCKAVDVVLRPEHKVTITSHDSGISVEQRDKDKLLFELVMSSSGISYREGEYIVYGGSFGFIFMSVNALSEVFIAQTKWNGYLWQQTYSQGIAQSEIVQVRPLENGESNGTIISFKPDFTIFDPGDFDYDTIAARARDIAYSLPGFTVTLRDERADPSREESFHFADGMADLVRHLNRERTPLHEVVSGIDEFPTDTKYHRAAPKLKIDFAFQYVDHMQTTVHSYANTSHTTSGGTHQAALIATIADVISDYVNGPAFSRDEIMPGLTAAVSVIHPSPRFESKSEVTLLNPDAYGAVATTVYRALRESIMSNLDHPHREGDTTLRGAIVNKCLANRRALNDGSQ
jgi:DNA gyrase subunit B